MQLTVVTTIFGLPTGQRQLSMQLTLPEARLTVSDLIACKVRQEVMECVTQQRSGRSGEYLTAEELLGTVPVAVPITVEDEIVRAQQAFAARAYMIVIDNRRVIHAAEALTLTPATRVEFIKILPLVGG